MSLATLYGIFLTSIVQGIIGGIGFAIAGIPHALFWGTAIALFSLIPVVGTSVVWVPASLILIATGNLTSGIFLFCWGILIVSTVDNFLRAFLIGGRTNTNQLLMFLSVFGGIGMFGLVGVIFGPLILTLFFAFLHIYELEYDKVLHRGKAVKPVPKK
jgi:predicted PurR-regulated permease PerM